MPYDNARIVGVVLDDDGKLSKLVVEQEDHTQQQISMDNPPLIAGVPVSDDWGEPWEGSVLTFHETATDENGPAWVPDDLPPTPSRIKSPNVYGGYKAPTLLDADDTWTPLVWSMDGEPFGQFSIAPVVGHEEFLDLEAVGIGVFIAFIKLVVFSGNDVPATLDIRMVRPNDSNINDWTPTVVDSGQWRRAVLESNGVADGNGHLQEWSTIYPIAFAFSPYERGWEIRGSGVEVLPGGDAAVTAELFITQISALP